MLELHYDVMKPRFGMCLRLLMMDTGSLIYLIESVRDPVHIFARMPQFDLSSFCGGRRAGQVP